MRQRLHSPGILLVSAAALLYELTLMRLFALAEWHHYAFLSVSVALLGNALSGTWAALALPVWRRRLDRWAPSALPLGLLGSYLVLAHLPFDSYLLAWDARQLVYLLVDWLALVLPFALSGYLLLRAMDARGVRSHVAYGANLAGGALGSLALPVVLPLVGGEGAVLVAALLAAVGGLLLRLAAAEPATLRQARRLAVAAGPLLAAALCGALLALRPAWWALPLSPYKSLSQALRTQGATALYQAWNSYSRVDVVWSPSLHSAPGLSLSFSGQLPPQLGLTIDGGDLSPIAQRASPADEAYLAYLPEALAYDLRPDARALVLAPRGGTQVALALHGGAAHVVAVEDNATVAAVVGQRFADYTGGLYADPRVTVLVESGRSALAHVSGPFDVLVIPLMRPYYPLAAGAYALSEDYIYTVEGFGAALDRLAPDGLLVVTRWAQDPPAEMLRATALLVEALAERGIEEAGAQLVAVRTWNTITLLASPTPWAPEDIAAVRARCQALGWDVLHAPGAAQPDDARFGLSTPAEREALATLLTAPDRAALYRAQDYDLAPPRDDRPFFEHYFRWAQLPAILAGLGKTWQPFGGSGYLLVLVLLLVAILVTGVLTALALRRRPSASSVALAGRQRRRAVAYFALVGLAYMLVEMPLLQQYILYLDHPARASALVVATLLLTSGLGSLLADRLRLRPALLALGLLLLGGSLALRALLQATLAWPLAARLAMGALALVPLGLLMGLPFSGGLRRLGAATGEALPWAWAANGGASVVSTMLATVLALQLGYRAVLWLGAACYLGAAWLLPARPPTEVPPNAPRAPAAQS